MPCMGPSPDEELSMERERNRIDYGFPWTDRELVINVACAFGKAWDGIAMTDHQRNRLPQWADRWWTTHKERDAAVLRQQIAATAAKDRDELQRLEALAVKHGFKLTRL